MSKHHVTIPSKRKQRKLRTIVARDGWICSLCGEPIDKSLPREHPMSWTFDHVIAVRYGGTNANGNLALAHYHCNNDRHNK